VKIEKSLEKSVKAVKDWMAKDSIKKYVRYGGLKFPAWLPYETAADQSAILLEGLTDFYQIKQDNDVLKFLNFLAVGILQMQKGDSAEVPFNAFLSWQNTWHAWGNSQASSLLYAGKILNKKKFISHAINEVKYFYPFLVNQNYLAAFKVEKGKNKNTLTGMEKFPQIAYGLRPDVFACLRAYKSTKNKRFLKTAIDMTGWFFGKNAAGVQMYDPVSGRCFDGIKDSSTVNKNSGAESTIEALLTLESLEEIPIAKKMLLMNYYKSKTKK
jgi:hypothetical protein